MKKCLICGNATYPMNEVDVTVAICESNEPAICEDCYSSTDETVQNKIDNILKEKEKQFPF